MRRGSRFAGPFHIKGFYKKCSVMLFPDAEGGVESSGNRRGLGISRFSSHLLGQKWYQFSQGYRPVPVVIRFALQPLQEVESENAMPPAPSSALLGKLIVVRGGNNADPIADFGKGLER